MKKTQEKFANKQEKLLIIDGNALIHRSFHALPPTMTTKDGTMVNAVYGFATVLLKAIREFRPEYVVLTLDKSGPTFRHEKFKEYKATRVKAPDELYAQIPLVKELAQSFDIPIFEKTGFEADDLIGTISKQVESKKYKVESIIVTGDMDTLQLIDDNTKVYTMSRGLSDSVIYDAVAVKTRYSLSVEQMIDYKALRGDPSDNIPGVRGIGEKTATELLSKFRTLDDIYHEIGKLGNLPRRQAGWEIGGGNKGVKNNLLNVVKPRIVDLLIEHKKDAYLSKELATINRNAPIKFDLEAARFGGFNQEKVVKFLSELEFKSLLPRIKDLERNNIETNKSAFAPAVTKAMTDKPAHAETSAGKFERNKNKFKYVLVDSEDKFKKFLAELKKQKEFAFDTETTGLDPLTCGLLGVSFSWEKKNAFFLSITGPVSSVKEREESNLFNYQEKSKILNLESKIKIHPWLEKLKPIFADEKIKKYAHNLKFDYRVLTNIGVEIKGLNFDTMIASFLLNPGSRQHNLDGLAFSELGFEKISKEDLLGLGRDKIEFAQVEVEKLSLYSCEDADITNQLVKKLKPQLKAQALDKLFREIEMPLVPVLAQMEDAGIKIDKNFLSEMSERMHEKIKELEKKIYKQAGQEFNIRSTQQLKEILFEKLQISTNNIKKNKTGISTAADELDKLKDLHPIIKLIQEHRELAKLTSTYVDALPDLVNKKTQRIHTSYNQTVTATGRLSSSDPNLQNIPIRTELGREIRKAFVAEKGYKLVALDYSQIELRLAAHMSGDQKMIKAFLNGADIHTMTAAEINQVNPEAVTPEMRREAKATNFGVLYGQGPHGLAQTAEIPYARAKEFIDQYFLVYEDVRKYIDGTIVFARENGFVETLFGRRRYLPEINSSVIMVRKAAERMAANTPLQGTAADMIKIAMIRIVEILNREEARLLLQVHDELVFEIRNDKALEYGQRIKKIMEEVISLKVPIVAEIKIGDNWGEME